MDPPSVCCLHVHSRDFSLEIGKSTSAQRVKSLHGRRRNPAGDAYCPAQHIVALNEGFSLFRLLSPLALCGCLCIKLVMALIWRHPCRESHQRSWISLNNSCQAAPNAKIGKRATKNGQKRTEAMKAKLSSGKRLASLWLREGWRKKNKRRKQDNREPDCRGIPSWAPQERLIYVAIIFISFSLRSPAYPAGAASFSEDCLPRCGLCIRPKGEKLVWPAGRFMPG